MPASYFPLDVNFFDHPKVVPLGDLTLRLYLSSVAYANRLMTDGFIARGVLGRLIEVPWDSGESPEDYAKELVRAILWHQADEPCPRGHDDTCPPTSGDGWRIHDFLDHNRSKATRLESQEAERARKAAWRQRQGQPQDKGISRDADVPRDTSVPETGDSAIPVTPRGRLTETETYTETRVPPSAARANHAPVTPIPTAQTFVAAYVDAYRGRANHDPPARVKGQVAKHLREAFDDGISADTIKAGFVEWFERDQHPATLPSFIEVAGRGGRPRGPKPRANQQVDQARRTYEEMMANAEQEGMGPHHGPLQPQLARPADHHRDR